MREGCLLTNYLPVLIHPRLKLKNLYTTYIKWKYKQVFLEPNFLKKERAGREINLVALVPVLGQFHVLEGGRRRGKGNCLI